MAAAAHFLIRKKLFNSKYPQLLVAKDFAVAERKLHLALSGRKYDPGKKAPKKRCTSDDKTTDPKPSTSQAQPQDESVSEQQPQDESISEQQPQDESISEQQPQGTSTSEQQPQGKASTDTQQEPVPSQFSNDEELPDAFAIATKLLPRKILDLYQRNQNIVYDQKHSTFNLLYLCLFFITDQRKMGYTLQNSCIIIQCQVHKFFFRFTIYQKLCTHLKCISLLFSVPIRRSTNSIFFQFAFINTFNQFFMF